MSNSLSNTSNIAKKATYLKLLARDLSDSLKNGNFKSLFKGQGIEFEGVRDYIRGDDIRSIDWNVTARLGHPFVKQFKEERELQLFLIIDNSQSMMHPISKYNICTESATLLTLASEFSLCPIGAVFFDGKVNFSIQPKFDKSQSLLILNHLQTSPKEIMNGTALIEALNTTGKILKTRTLIFIFSDFRASGWQKQLISLAHQNDLIAIKICDDFDYNLPDLGTLSFQDAETKQTMLLPTSSHKFREKWKNYYTKQENDWKNFCLKHRILPVIMNTKDDYFQVLQKALKNELKR